MLDLYAVRRVNVSLLKDVIGTATIREHAGYANDSYVSHLVSGHRRMGEKAARHLESSLALPDYWLDALQDHVPPQTLRLKNTRPYPRILPTPKTRPAPARRPPGNFDDITAMLTAIEQELQTKMTPEQMRALMDSASKGADAAMLERLARLLLTR